MSVDYDTCDCCGEAKYEEFVGDCTKCGHQLCTDCLINNDINSSYACDYGIKFDGSEKQKEEYGIESKEDSKYGYEIGEIIEDTSIDPKYCPFCNGDEVDEAELLDFILDKYINKSKDELIKEFKEDKNINK